MFQVKRNVLNSIYLLNIRKQASKSSREWIIKISIFGNNIVARKTSISTKVNHSPMLVIDGGNTFSALYTKFYLSISYLLLLICFESKTCILVIFCESRNVAENILNWPKKIKTLKIRKIMFKQSILLWNKFFNRPSTCFYIYIHNKNSSNS